MRAAAELERGLIKARLHGGRAARPRLAATPAGLVAPQVCHDLVDGACVPVEHEQEAISRILGYRNAKPGSLSWALIAEALNAERIPPPSGAEWYPVTCRRIAIARTINTAETEQPTRSCLAWSAGSYESKITSRAAAQAARRRADRLPCGVLCPRRLIGSRHLQQGGYRADRQADCTEEAGC